MSLVLNNSGNNNSPTVLSCHQNLVWKIAVFTLLVLPTAKCNSSTSVLSIKSSSKSHYFPSVLPHSARPVSEGLPACDSETGELRWAAVPGTLQPSPRYVEIQRLGSHWGLSLPLLRRKWPPHLQRGSRGSRSLWVLVRGMGPRCWEELQPPPGWIHPDSGCPTHTPTAGRPRHHHPRRPGDI